MRSHRDWCDLLLKMVADMPRLPTSHNSRHASAIVYRNQVAAFGFNSLKSHPLQVKYGKNSESIFLHSEVDAIKNSLRSLSLRELSRSTIYVARIKQISSVDNRLVPGMSCPCAGCMRAIVEFDIKRVIYTCDDGGIEEITRS